MASPVVPTKQPISRAGSIDVRFEVKVYREADGVMALALDAPTPEDAQGQARQLGYTVLAVRQIFALRGFFSRRRERFPLTLFSQQLLALLEAGLALVEALETLAEKEATGPFKKTLQELLVYLYEGQTLSHAMQQLPGVFPDLYVATVRASEKTGDLPESLRRYSAYSAQLDVVKKKLISASIYPVLLIAIGGLVMLFLLTFVLPRFSHIYEDQNANLSFLSRAFLSWGQFFEAHGAGFLATLVGLVALLVFWLAQPGTRRWIGEWLWTIPAVGERMRTYQLSRFYRTLGILLRGGTPLVPALDMVSGLLPVHLRAPLRAASRSISEGVSMSQALETQNLVTPVSLRLIRVGERTGRMDDMMERIAGFYDEEISRWVDVFSKLFEPLLMALIGLLIGGVVVMMYLPIFELAGSLQ